MTRRPSPLSPTPAVCGWRSGFTLIELMIALTIGLVMMVALVALFTNSNRGNSELAKMNSLIENGRFAIQLLQSDLVLAGFWGTFLPKFNDLYATSTADFQVPSAIPDPCLAYTSWDAAYRANLIGIPVQVYDAIPTSCTGILTDRLADTDILVVRYAESCALLWNAATSTWSPDPGSPNCEVNTNGKLYFQSSLRPATCASVEAPYVLAAGTSITVPPAPFSLHTGNCTSTTIAEKRKFVSHIYYVRNYAVSAGDGIPTLMRADFDLAGGTLAHQPATPLIEGIEGFRVELGFDSLSKTGQQADYAVQTQWDTANTNTPKNRGDGMPDGPFARCTTSTPCIASCSPSSAPTTCSIASNNCSATTDSACIAKRQLMNVTAARIYVLARARERTPGYRDTKFYRLGADLELCPQVPRTACTLVGLDYKRHVFSTTVRLTNIAIRRETP